MGRRRTGGVHPSVQLEKARTNFQDCKFPGSQQCRTSTFLRMSRFSPRPGGLTRGSSGWLQHCKVRKRSGWFTSACLCATRNSKPAWTLAMTLRNCCGCGATRFSFKESSAHGASSLNAWVSVWRLWQYAGLFEVDSAQSVSDTKEPLSVFP